VALHDGMGKGSARSVAGINLFDALQQCSDTLVGFGGHAAAAGLQIDQNQLPAFERRFEAAVETLAAHSELTPEIVLDAVLELGQITPALTDALEALQPHGNQNPEPLFMAHDIHVVDAQIVGKHHLRMRLQPNHDKTHRPLSAIQFNIDPGVQFPKHFERIAFRLRWNCWNGNRRIQLLIEET
jgi:single-stranded-DNA-specific exonuclease